MLAPRFRAGTIWFLEGADWLDELELEFLTFPDGAKDDLIDTVAYFEQIMEVPASVAHYTDLLTKFSGKRVF